jgi:hypothetical protein
MAPAAAAMIRTRKKPQAAPLVGTSTKRRRGTMQRQILNSQREEAGETINHASRSSPKTNAAPVSRLHAAPPWRLRTSCKKR